MGLDQIRVKGGKIVCVENGDSKMVMKIGGLFS